jgi:hypothetical protein
VTAITQLTYRDQITVNDIDKGLSDSAMDVRTETAFALHSVFKGSKDEELYRGYPAKGVEIVEIKRQLAPVLLKHLNDPNPFTRATIAKYFRSMLKIARRSKGKITRNKTPDFFPAKIDWHRDSWHKCENTKKLWTKWWGEHGEDWLETLHPSQE